MSNQSESGIDLNVIGPSQQRGVLEERRLRMLEIAFVLHPIHREVGASHPGCPGGGYKNHSGGHLGIGAEAPERDGATHALVVLRIALLDLFP